VSAGEHAGSAECRALFERLSDYLDGELEAEVCSKLDLHLSGCPPCRAFLESLRRTVALTRDLPPTPLPEEMRRRLLEAYRELRRSEEK